MKYSLLLLFLLGCGQKEKPTPLPPNVIKLQEQIKELKAEVEHQKSTYIWQMHNCLEEAQNWKQQVDALIEACNRKDQQIQILSQPK